jgi:hypothetical protein
MPWLIAFIASHLLEIAAVGVAAKSATEIEEFAFKTYEVVKTVVKESKTSETLKD